MNTTNPTKEEILRAFDDDVWLEKTPCQLALDKIITAYPPLQEIKERIQKVEPSNLPILILGETGTGKELIAEALHGARKGKFVAVNCGGIPGELLEAEFFGCVKGAYTGAYQDRQGYVKEAENGTLFLDEIGDMPAMLQIKLLRVLQSKKFRRVGSAVEESANFRLVSATNKTNLEDSDRFRLDLYYRIAGHIIRLPSLQERGAEDIKLIVAAKVGANNEAMQKQILDYLTTHNLKGNIRQLINIIEEYKVIYG